MSGKPRSVARKACDLCRKRKVRCIFNVGSATGICFECAVAGVPCTFRSNRKPRGPPNRCVADAKRCANAHVTGCITTPLVSSSPLVGPPSLPIEPVTMSHFVPGYILKIIIRDFFERVYPTVPIVHGPTFQAALDCRRYDSDPAFLRLVFAIIAITVASIPSKLTTYGNSRYQNVGEMVGRASHLIVLSRINTEPIWNSQPTIQAMTTSIILALATHSAGLYCTARNILNEAIHFFRLLELYKKDAYLRLNLDVIDAEMCKRAFWIIFIMTMLDRMAFAVPHFSLAFNPVCTDWQFLVPLELSDEQLHSYSPYQDINARKGVRQPPMISGFIALIRVFLCVVDLIGKIFPSPLQLYNGPPIVPGSRITRDINHQDHDFFTFLPTLESFHQVMIRLHSLAKNLPNELKRLQHQPDGNTYWVGKDAEGLSAPFGIMRANIHVTSIYLQWSILEMCLNKLTSQQHDYCKETTGQAPSIDTSSWNQDLHAADELHQFRQSLTRELIEVVRSCPPIVLESCGLTMITMIREVGATLLDPVTTAITPEGIQRDNQKYITQFIEILENLNYAPKFSGLNEWRRSGATGT